MYKRQFLINKECHGAWVNSATLRMFGIDKNTPDPLNGSYSRYEDGEPDGYVHEMAAVKMQEKLFETITDEAVSYTHLDVYKRQVIKRADHIIDLGPDGGFRGGMIVAEGTPEEVAEVEGSYTGEFLKKMLKAR